MTDLVEAAEDMAHWMVELGNETTDEAAEQLRALREDPALVAWHALLAHCAEEQATRRRQEAHRWPDPPVVLEALAGGPPATPADLKACVLDALDELDLELRLGRNDPALVFWARSRDEHGQARPAEPLPENECSRILADRLATVLRTQRIIAARPEAQYAQGKRADIECSIGQMNIPIEAKGQWHRHLWTAAQDQLAARYARDPGAQGYGIYVVYWFGLDVDQRYAPRPGPNGENPQTAEELKQALEAQLPAELRGRISIVVLDLSLPQD